MSEENTSADSGDSTGDKPQELPTWNRGKSKRKSKAEAAEVVDAGEGDPNDGGDALIEDMKCEHAQLNLRKIGLDKNASRRCYAGFSHVSP